MSTIEELVTFLTRENYAAHGGKTSGMSQPDGAAAAALRWVRLAADGQERQSR